MTRRALTIALIVVLQACNGFTSMKPVCDVSKQDLAGKCRDGTIGALSSG